MNALTEEDIKLVESTFESYKTRYEELSKRIEEASLPWEYAKGGLFYNFLPLEIERSGFKKGKLFKNEPDKKDEIVAYARNHDRTVAMRYFVIGHVSAETFYLSEAAVIIRAKFSDGIQLKALDQLTMIFSATNRPEYALMYSVDRRNHTVVKEVYTYTDGQLSEIRETGYISRTSGRIGIDRTTTVEYSGNTVSEIYVQDNNLASGAVKKTQVFP